MIQKTPKTAWELAGEELGNYLDEESASEFPLEAFSGDSLDAILLAMAHPENLGRDRPPSWDDLIAVMPPEAVARIEAEERAYREGRPPPPSDQPKSFFDMTPEEYAAEEKRSEEFFRRTNDLFMNPPAWMRSSK